MKSIKFIILTYLLGSMPVLNLTAENKEEMQYVDKYIFHLSEKNLISDNPLIVLDSTEVSYTDFKSHYNLSKSDINDIGFISKASDRGVNQYGVQAKEGVILITSKKSQEQPPASNGSSDVYIIVDGKHISSEEFEKISMEDIATVEVLKEKNEVQRITKGDYDGVIFITLKKK